MDVDVSKRRRRGRIDLLPGDKRTHTISTRLNDEELNLLNQKCAEYKMQRGEFLRTAAIHKLPPQIPQVNAEQWVELARSASNLNQIAHHLNNAGSDYYISEIETIRKELSNFRNTLLNIKLEPEN
jgi:hypothetical protein